VPQERRGRGTLPEEPTPIYSEHGTAPCRLTILVKEKGQEHSYQLDSPVDVFGDRARKML
jgi:hypothetical protein